MILSDLYSLRTSPLASIERDAIFVLNIFAVSVSSPQGLVNGSVVAHIVFSHHFLNVLSGLNSVIERHVREQVMCDVCIGDMMEEIVEEGSPRAVNGAHGSAQPGPFFLIKVRHVDVCVVQVGETHQMGMHDEVGHEIVEDKG